MEERVELDHAVDLGRRDAQTLCDRAGGITRNPVELLLNLAQDLQQKRGDLRRWSTMRVTTSRLADMIAPSWVRYSVPYWRRLETPYAQRQQRTGSTRPHPTSRTHTAGQVPGGRIRQQGHGAIRPSRRANPIPVKTWRCVPRGILTTPRAVIARLKRSAQAFRRDRDGRLGQRASIIRRTIQPRRAEIILLSTRHCPQTPIGLG